MQFVLDLWDWSSEAAVAVSRTSQAAVIEYLDRAMHLPMTGSTLAVRCTPPVTAW